MTETAKMLQISQATISRIRAADFDVVKFNKNNDERRIREKNKKADEAIAAALEEAKKAATETAEIPGQMRMELPAEAQKPEMSDQTKLMRFQAHQADRIMQMQQGIINKLDRLNDTMCQILRAIRNE